MQTLFITGNHLRHIFLVKNLLNISEIFHGLWKKET